MQDDASYFVQNVRYNPTAARQITYSQIEVLNLQTGQTSLTSDTFISGTMIYLYLKAAVGCKEWQDPQ